MRCSSMLFDPSSGLNRNDLRALFRNWYRPAWLDAHPWTKLSVVQAIQARSNADDAAGVLRQVVLQAIASVWPETDRPTLDRRKRVVLEEHYLKGKPLKHLADALHVTERTVRRILVEALDDLVAFLREAEQQAQANDWSYAPLCVNLAPPLAMHTRLFGRQGILACLVDALTSGAPICAIWGMPGVGKTALLTHLAHHPVIRRRFCDGVLWAALTMDTDPLVVLRAWGMALGLSQADLDSVAASPASLGRVIAGMLMDRRVLIVLDDVASPELARQFMLGGRRCGHVIATDFAHVALALSPSHFWEVTPLGDADSRALLGASASEGEDEAEALEDILAWCGGLPLALTLVGRALARAARSGNPRRLQTVRAQLCEADHRLMLLRDDDASSLGELSRAVRQTVAQIPPRQWRALHMLAVLPPSPASFDETTALSMLDGDVTSLDELVDRGLLQCLGEKYTIHPVLREVLLADLSAADVHRQGQLRLVQIVQAMVEAAGRHDPIPFRHQDLILAAARTAAELGMTKAARALSLRLASTLAARGWPQLADALLTTAQPDQAELPDAIHLQAQHAYVLVHLGQPSRAQACAARAVALAEQVSSEADARVAALVALAWTQMAADDLEGAIYTCQRAPVVETTDPRLVLALRRIHAITLFNAGRYAEARPLLKEALSLAQAIGAVEDELVILNTLGGVARQTGRCNEAERWFEQALRCARMTGMTEQASLALTVLSLVALDRNRHAQAAAYLAEAEPAVRRLGLPFPMLMLRQAQATLHMRRREWARAEGILREALQLAEHIRWGGWQASLSAALGECLLAVGCLDEARRVCETGLLQARAGSYADLEALLRYVMSRIAHAQGDVQAAQEWVEPARMQLRRSKHHRADEVAAWMSQLSA